MYHVEIHVIDTVNNRDLAYMGLNVTQGFTQPEIIEAAAIFIASVAEVQADVDREPAEEDKPLVPATYTATLTHVGEDKHINAIKELRTFAGLTLKDAKDAVDAVRDKGTPWIVKDGLSSEDALALKSAFEAAGASVVLT